MIITLVQEGRDVAKTVAASRTIISRVMTLAEASQSGNVHGGEILKFIDSAAGVAAMRHARTAVATVRIDDLSFVAPVRVGDVVTALASVNGAGRTSMDVGVRVEAENLLTAEVRHVATAYLVLVALDAGGKPTAVPRLIADTDDERRRMLQADARRGWRLRSRGKA